MNYLIFIVAAAAAPAGLVQGQQALGEVSGEFLCDLVKCQNGVFNQGLCECECIPPYCVDLNGDCTNPSNSCGGNPWTDCVKGVNCPWWNNLLKQEACTTGWEVPVNTWDLYATREACCNENFPYSEICNGPLAPEPPTKHPTIVAQEDDYENVLLSFDVSGLPDDVSMIDLKDEMKTVLTRILLQLAKSIEGLSVKNVEQTVQKLDEEYVMGGKTVHFIVEVVRVEGTKFGPLIIKAIRDSYDEVLDQIQTLPDTEYFGTGVNINLCTLQNGAILCVKEKIATPVPVPQPLVVESDPDNEGGLAGWAISLIIIVVLLVVCCMGYAIAVVCFGVANCFDDCFRDHDDTKEIHNNIYWDDRSRGSRQGRNMLAIEDGSRASGYASRRSGRSREIALATPEDPSFDDDSFTINTYGTKHKQGRDPTMYIPGQEDKPDPNSESGCSSDNNSSRRYYEDPPLKPKREPTMYVDGNRYAVEDPPLKPMRDPTMYIDGHRETDIYTIDESTVEEVQNDYRGVDKRPRDPTFYVNAAERDKRSLSIKSARSKKSTRSKKSSKGNSGESPQSADWNASDGDSFHL